MVKVKDYILNVDCGICKGSGQTYEWNEDKKPVEWIVVDCSSCNGLGHREVDIIDKRKESIKKDIILPTEY